MVRFSVHVSPLCLRKAVLTLCRGAGFAGVSSTLCNQRNRVSCATSLKKVYSVKMLNYLLQQSISTCTISYTDVLCQTLKGILLCLYNSSIKSLELSSRMEPETKLIQ